MLANKIGTWLPSLGNIAHGLLNSLRVVGSLIILSWLLPYCGKATKPKPVTCNIYISATGWHSTKPSSRFDQLYVYDADSLSLIDSIPLTSMADALEVSPDGRCLYAQCADGGLFKIDALTRNVVWSVPGMGRITLVDAGRLVAREGLEGTDVIDVTDGHVIKQLPLDIRVLSGPSNGTTVAAILDDTTPDFHGDSAVTVFDVRTGAHYGYYVPRLSTGEALQAIYVARLHPDGKRVAVIGLFGSVRYCWFMVGDVLTGETLLRQQITRPFGDIAISEDGKLAVVTDPGQPWYGEGGNGPSVFDLTTLKHLKTLREESDLLSWAPAQVRFVSGDRKIAFAPYPMWGGGTVFIVNRATLVGERAAEKPYSGAFLGALGTGPRP